MASQGRQHAKKHSACTGCRILDVATGTGDLALLLNRKLKPAKIIGIDISEKMIDIARQKYSSESKTENRQEVEFMTADCLNMPFSNESFKLSQLPTESGILNTFC